MTKVKSCLLYGLSISTLLFSSLEGSIWDCKNWLFEIDNGYRWDRINEAIEVVDFENIQPYASAEFQYKNLDSYQLGGRFLWEPCQWYVKGTAHYGWIFDYGSFNSDGVVRGKIQGNTADASGGVGYIIPICDCFKFVPLIGFGYDHHHLKTKRIKLFQDNCSCSDSYDSYSSIPTTSYDSYSSSSSIGRLRHTKLEASWYAPWIGFDILYDAPFDLWCKSFNLSFTSGYEFHYGWTHLKHTETYDCGDKISFHNTMNNMMGHVFHFDTRYRFCNDWVVGLILQYTYWSNAHKKHDKFSGSNDGGLLATQDQRTFELRWQAINTILTVGKTF